MGKKKSNKRTIYQPFEEETKVKDDSKRSEEMLSKSSDKNKDETNVENECNDEYEEKSFERREVKSYTKSINNKDEINEQIDDEGEYKNKNKKSKRKQKKTFKNSNNNNEMIHVQNEDKGEHKKSFGSEKESYKNSIKNKYETIEQIEVEDEFKNKSSKRKKNSFVEVEIKSHYHCKRSEVETTNYENSNEDVKNNQTEDKRECKESLNEGVKTEVINEINHRKNKAENRLKKKKDMQSKDHFVDKKSQSEQKQIHMDNSNKSNTNIFNSSKKNTNEEENKPKKKKKNKFGQQSEEESLDDNIFNKLDKTIFMNRCLEEIDADLFKLPKTVSLAHCVAEDLRMGAGIAVDFKRIYGGVGSLIDQNLKIGDVGIIHNHDDQYVFYLITKKYSNGKPNMMTMEMALKSLLKKMKELNLNQLGIPKIGCGLDALDWSDVKSLIMDIFSNSGIQIFVCIPSKVIERKAPQSLKVYFTPGNLWEMQDKTDIVILINLEQIYTDNWTDEVIDNVNTKYPFKENLLKDIKNDKLNAGDIRKYNVYDENIFCAFINKNEYSSLENAFRKVLNYSTKKRYMYLALQTGSIADKFKNVAWTVLIYRSISSFSELWLCGDSTQTNQSSYDQYCRSLRNSMNYSSKYNSPNQVNYKRNYYNTSYNNNTKKEINIKNEEESLSNQQKDYKKKIN